MARIVKTLLPIVIMLFILEGFFGFHIAGGIFKLPIELARTMESWLGLVVLALVLLSPLLIFSRSKSRDGESSDRPFVDDEARQIQELYQQMEKLADRVESLETILMDRIKKG